MEEKQAELKKARQEAVPPVLDVEKDKSASSDAAEALKAVAEAARENDWSSAQLKEQVLKKMRHKGKGKKGQRDSKEEILKKVVTSLNSKQREM